MITTVCLNPAIDRTVTLDSLQPGCVNRALQARTDAGGKGINVALVLQHLGAEVSCIWCAPENGSELVTRALEAHRIPHQPIRVPGSVRMNTKLVSGDGTTDINETGAAMTADALEAVYTACSAIRPDTGFMVLTGSLPPDCPKGTYRELIRRIPVPTVLDVSGEELLLGLEAHPFLIKPNDEELKKTLGISIRSDADLCQAATRLMDMGAQNVLISLGGKGAMLFTENRVLRCGPLDVPVRSTVGAGDAMVAGILYGVEQTGSLADAFGYGVAAGSAAVTMEGTQPFRPEDFYRLLAQVKIQEVSRS